MNGALRSGYASPTGPWRTGRSRNMCARAEYPVPRGRDRPVLEEGRVEPVDAGSSDRLLEKAARERS